LTNVQKARSFLRKGKVAFRKKEFEEAIPHFDTCIALHPLENAWRFKGRCLRDLDRCDDALIAFGELVKMAPG
jgi:tetratricopeptide (TPR) repeat protein